MSWPEICLAELLEDIQPGFASGLNIEDGILQVRMNNVKPDGSWDWSKERRVPATIRQLEKYSLQSGDILFNATNSPEQVGKSALFQKFDEPVTFSNHFLRLKVKKSKVDERYLIRYLASLWKKRVFENMVDAWVNQATVQRDSFLALQIPVPPLPEQKRIAAILDKADSLSRKNQQAIQLADKFLRAVFLDMFGDPVTNPKAWDVKQLKEGVLSIKSGWSANGESIPCNSEQLGVLKISAVTSGVFKASENKYVPSETIPKNKALIFPKKGDLLFSRANTRELVAATCIVPESNDNVFLPDKLWKVETNKEKLMPEFLHYSIQQPRFRDLLTSQATGTSGSMLNISKAKFEESDIIFPDIRSQKKFAEIYWKIQKVFSKLNQSSVYSFDGFNSLSQKAFAGEL